MQLKIFHHTSTQPVALPAITVFTLKFYCRFGCVHRTTSFAVHNNAPKANVHRIKSDLIAKNMHKHTFGCKRERKRERDVECDDKMTMTADLKTLLINPFGLVCIIVVFLFIFANLLHVPLDIKCVFLYSTFHSLSLPLSLK